MTNYSETEIAALKTTFPGTTVYLCDFYREQAWERWIRERKHRLSTSDAEWLLSHVHGPHPLQTNTFLLDHHFQQAVTVY